MTYSPMNALDALFFPANERRTRLHTRESYSNRTSPFWGSWEFRPSPVQPTVTASCWVKTSLWFLATAGVPSPRWSPGLTSETSLTETEMETWRTTSLSVQGEGTVGAFGLGPPHPGQLGGSPVLKQLFAWMFRDHAQDSRRGSSFWETPSRQSPAEGTAAVFQV